MQYKMLIDGEWSDAADGGTWQVVNPATEASVANVPFGGADETTRAISAAHEVLPGWQALTAYDRCAILRDIADALRSRSEELAPIMTAECGKPYGEALGEWGACADLFDWFAEEGKRAYGRTIPARKPGKRLLSLPQPIGVVATITAWNFPGLSAGAEMGGRPGRRLHYRRPAQRADADERNGAGQRDGGSGHSTGRCQSHQWRSRYHGRDHHA